MKKAEPSKNKTVVQAQKVYNEYISNKKKPVVESSDGFTDVGPTHKHQNDSDCDSSDADLILPVLYGIRMADKDIKKVCGPLIT